MPTKPKNPIASLPPSPTLSLSHSNSLAHFGSVSIMMKLGSAANYLWNKDRNLHERLAIIKMNKLAFCSCQSRANERARDDECQAVGRPRVLFTDSISHSLARSLIHSKIFNTIWMIEPKIRFLFIIKGHNFIYSFILSFVWMALIENTSEHIEALGNWVNEWGIAL